MRNSLLAYGFRPHFLLAGLAAVVLVPAWALGLVAGTGLGTSWPPTLWHGHEMLHGFIASAIAGFLLTAVPSWTGQKGWAGAPLAAMSATWLLARLLVATSGHWPGWLVAVVDLAFVPMLAALVAPPLLRSRNRNTPLLAVLAAFWLSNLAFHVALLRGDPPTARTALFAGIDLVLVLVTVIGGRIVPAFTTSGLRQAGIECVLRTRPWLDRLAVAAMVAVAAGDVLWPDHRGNGYVAAAAALLQALRLAQWQGWRTLRLPLAWVLHLAYLWLPLGLALKAAALLGGALAGAFWLHALTIGALALMILAVMSRASLGHTGRPLTAHPLTTLAYLLLAAAAVVRVFGLAAFRLSFVQVVALSALLWACSFLLYLVIYAPILWRPRADGRPG